MDSYAWDVLCQDATGYGTRGFLTIERTHPRAFYARHMVTCRPFASLKPSKVVYVGMAADPLARLRRVGESEGLVIWEQLYSCSDQPEQTCGAAILAGPSDEVLRPVYMLQSDPSLMGIIGQSSLIREAGRTYLRSCTQAHGSGGYGNHADEYWVLRAGEITNIRLAEALETAWSRMQKDGWSGARFCGGFAKDWPTPPARPHDILFTHHGASRYGCASKSGSAPVQVGRSVRVRFRFVGDWLRFSSYDVGPEPEP
jgi:hypothetical protein